MKNPEVFSMRALRVVLFLDGFLLFFLGAGLICAPARMIAAFHFPPLPAGINYLIGLWGCVLVTMAAAYFLAATDPIEHLLWIQVGIARGILELILGVIYCAKGWITWEQGGFGTVAAGLIAVAYVALYPRRRRLIRLAIGKSKGAET